MAVGGVVISFLVKSADAIRDSDRLSRALDDVGKAGGKAGGKGGIGGLVSSMGAAVPIVGAVAIGVVGAAGALIDMGKAAWEDAQQANRLAHTLGNIPGVTQKMIDKNEEWITSMQLATLVSDTDLRAAISKLTLATGDLGEAQKLAALAADVAAGSGKNYATVADAMAKAAAGNTAQLERMFPWLDKNKDGTVTLAEAQKELGKKFKGAADEAAKNDPWKRIGIIFDELKEAIGTSLLPVLKKLSDWFASKENQKKIKEFLDKVAELAQKVGEDLVQALEDFVAWLKKPENQQKIKDWVKKAQDLAKAFAEVVSAIQSVISWLSRIPKPPSWMTSSVFDKLTGRSSAGSPGAPSAASRGATSTSSTPAPAPAPTVIVTDEQIARAIMRVLLKSQARNGRLVMTG